MSKSQLVRFTKIFNSHFKMLLFMWLWKESGHVHFKKTSKMPIVESYKSIMQCLISVNNKVKSKVYYGQEEVWIYSPPLCTIMIKPKHFSSVQTIKKKNEFSNSIFLEYLYENELQHDGKVMKEVTNNKLLKIFN